MEELLAKLIARNDELVDQVIKLSNTIVALCTPHPMQFPSVWEDPGEKLDQAPDFTRKYYNEEQEDMVWEGEQGIRSQNEVKSLLHELDFANTDLEIS